MDAKKYMIRTSVAGRHYYYQSKKQNGNEMIVEWTAFIHRAEKFESLADIVAFKEENPVIKGRNVIYRKIAQ